MSQFASTRRSAMQFAAAIIFTLASLVAPQASPAQTYTVVDNLSGQLPSILAVGLTAAQGRDGDFYASSLEGGTHGLGAIFKFTASGTLTTLYSFDGTVGQFPYGGLTLGTDGNFYGTTNRGGSSGNGSVYKVTPAGVVTLLHTFTNTGDGTNPDIAPIQGNDGNFYGTASGVDVSTTLANSTIYKITPTGTFTMLHTLSPATEGSNVGYLILGADGNFYGQTGTGGANGWGTIFKVTPSGAFTLLHTFSNLADGRLGGTLAQAANGTFYGSTFLGGANGAGVVFKMTASGTFTKLHDMNSSSDGSGVIFTTLGTDGNLYNIAETGGASNAGTISKVTPAGVFTKLYDFATQGVTPLTGLTESTSGLLYGSTENGGSGNAGVLYSFNVSLSPFVSLMTTSGRVGSKIEILGQGFSAASVVQFNGVTATTVARTGTTYLLATVPAGASDGFVTVTTGATTLTSSKKFTVHDSWGSGAVVPVGTVAACAAALNGQIYVVGGYNSSAQTSVQIYNPATNKWSTGTALPSALSNQACAGVNGAVYEFGGTTNEGSTQTNAVLAYNPTTKTWSTKSAMPVAREDTVAVVANNLVYVIDGFNGNRLATVDVYNPASDTWAVGTSLLTAQSGDVGGLISGDIVISGGAGQSVDTGDTESFSVSGNTWTALKADPDLRNNACGGVIGTTLYVAGGADRSVPVLTINEAFSPSKNLWTTLSPLPHATVDAASAVSGGQLYCFAGEKDTSGTVINNVQIYQP